MSFVYDLSAREYSISTLNVQWHTEEFNQYSNLATIIKVVKMQRDLCNLHAKSEISLQHIILQTKEFWQRQTRVILLEGAFDPPTKQNVHNQNCPFSTFNPIYRNTIYTNRSLYWTYRQLKLSQLSGIIFKLSIDDKLFTTKKINVPISDGLSLYPVVSYAYRLQCLQRCFRMQKQQIKPTGNRNIAQQMPQQVNSVSKLCLQTQWLPVCTIWIVLTTCCCCCWCRGGCTIIGWFVLAGWMIGGPKKWNVNGNHLDSQQQTVRWGWYAVIGGKSSISLFGCHCTADSLCDSHINFNYGFVSIWISIRLYPFFQFTHLAQADCWFDCMEVVGLME